MALSLKRAAELDKENVPTQSLKRPCLLNSVGATHNLLFIRDPVSLKDCYTSSDDESTDNNNTRSSTSRNSKRLRSKRRNHRSVNRKLVSAPLNMKLSRAVSQYSDEEDNYESPVSENDYKSAPNAANVNNTPKSMTRKLSSTVLNGLPSPSFELTPGKSRNFLPDSDFSARCRCFDYLVGAIDEAWARYCDATSYEEDEVYGYDAGNSGLPQTPASVVTSDDDGYRTEASAATSITDYDSDFTPTTTASNATFTSMMGAAAKMSSSISTRRVSEVPSNVRLQQLKDRLIKSKYYLQDYVDSEDVEECFLFWKKWDLIKYSTIELVEDDDDDDIVERTIESLEVGRYASTIGV